MKTRIALVVLVVGALLFIYGMHEASNAAAMRAGPYTWRPPYTAYELMVFQMESTAMYLKIVGGLLAVGGAIVAAVTWPKKDAPVTVAPEVPRRDGQDQLPV